MFDVIQETLESDLFSAYFLSVITLGPSRGRKKTLTEVILCFYVGHLSLKVNSKESKTS